MARMSSARRNALPAHAFAVPETRQLPISDPSHARNAAARLSETQGLSDHQRSLARARIESAISHFRGKDLDMDMQGTAAGYVTCDACMAGVPSACMCAQCDGNHLDLCMCDMASRAAMAKDYSAALGFSPYRLEGQKDTGNGSGDRMAPMLPMAAGKAAYEVLRKAADEEITYVHYLAKYDEATGLFEGIVSDDSLDLDKQIADKGWLDRALPKWFSEYGNMREMHQPIAAGKATKLTETENGYRLVSRPVRAETKELLKNEVLQAYSIGIKNAVLAKDPIAINGRIVEGDIIEVSYVDFPANTNCKIVPIAKMAGGTLTPIPEEIDVNIFQPAAAQGAGAPAVDPAEAIKTASTLRAASLAKDASAPALDGVTAELPTPGPAPVDTSTDTLDARMKNVESLMERLANEVGRITGAAPLAAEPNTTPAAVAAAATPPQSWSGGPLKAALSAALAELFTPDALTKGATTAESPLAQLVKGAVDAQTTELRGRVEAMERIAGPAKGAVSQVAPRGDAQAPDVETDARAVLEKAASEGRLSEADAMKALHALNFGRLTRTR